MGLLTRRSGKDLVLARDVNQVNDSRIAAFLGVAAEIEPQSVAPAPQRDQTVADYATREGTTLVINRPRDVWPWLDRRRREPRERKKGTLLLLVASFLVLALAAGQGYVSWFAQYLFILAAKKVPTASGIEALGLDTGAVIFALLALALVRLERRAIVPRILNVSCAAGSLAMNVLGADLLSPRSIAIYALPSALYATASDQLIAVVRRHALPAKVDDEEQRSAWAMAWRGLIRVASIIALIILWVLRIPLYILRLSVAPKETYGGLRQLVLDLTPLPEATGGSDEGVPDPKPDREQKPRRRRKGRGDGRKGGPTKKAILLGLYASHPGFGDRAHVAAAARALAGQAGLGDGTARAYIYEFLSSTPAGELDTVQRELQEGGVAA